jgi:hypothetical protein
LKHTEKTKDKATTEELESEGPTQLQVGQADMEDSSRQIDLSEYFVKTETQFEQRFPTSANIEL